MTEEMDDFDRLVAERMAPITIMDLKDGSISTPYDRNDARKQIGYGRAIETIPTDPEQAKQWLVRLYERVVGEMHQAGAREDMLRLGLSKSAMDVFRDFREWCAENGFQSLPVSDIRGVVRFLLHCRANGTIDAHVGVYADVIEAFHKRTYHPVFKAGHMLRRGMSKVARDDFHRATVFSRRQLALDDRRIDHSGEEVAAHALRMFPDGDIPDHWHEIAA